LKSDCLQKRVDSRSPQFPARFFRLEIRLPAKLRPLTTRYNPRLAWIPEFQNRNYLHPNEKKPVGTRLAIGARGAVYGEPIEYSGPIPDGAASFVSGRTVVINLSHLGNGLITSDGKAPGPFKIAGSNGRYQNATATIAGNALYVTSSSVSVPKSVRYQWDYGVGNVYNRSSIPTSGGAGSVDRLPASQFELTFP
jgi:sialate O-acetylesterase